MDEKSSSTIMAVLSTLSEPELGDLTLSLSRDLLRQRRRIAAVLSSPTLFSLTLHRLRLLSLPAKTALLSQHLLSSLRRLTPGHHHRRRRSAADELPRRDLDAVLLLLLLCDTRHRSPDRLRRTPPALWREALAGAYAGDLLTPSTSAMGSTAVAPYVDAVARCLKLVGTATEPDTGSGVGVPASVAAVVALPSVEGGGGGECAICREEMKDGRDVCQMPCGHVFHWKCVLTWLRKHNTCPCCRFQLPTDDVVGEIRRLWDVLLQMARPEKDIL